MTESGQCLTDEIFDAQAERLKDVRAQLRQSLQALGCDSVFISKMVLAVNEACMNVIQHAYSGSGEGKFRLQVHRSDCQLIFRLTDWAPPVDRERIVIGDPEDVRPGGLGVFFIHEIMDQVEFLDVTPGTGNILEMKKTLTQMNP